MYLEKISKSPRLLGPTPQLKERRKEVSYLDKNQQSDQDQGGEKPDMNEEKAVYQDISKGEKGSKEEQPVPEEDQS